MSKYKCTNCLRKHLALCKSFIKEVLDGHGEGGVPDHRIDIEGEIANAEYHAEVINNLFLRKVRYFRRDLQNRKFVPVFDDLKTVDTLYYFSDSFDGIIVDQGIIDEYENIKAAEVISVITSNNISTGCGCNKK